MHSDMDEEDEKDILKIATESEEKWNTWRNKRKLEEYEPMCPTEPTDKEVNGEERYDCLEYDSSSIMKKPKLDGIKEIRPKQPKDDEISVEGGKSNKHTETPNSRKNVEQNAGTKEMEHENVTNNVPDNRNDVQVPTDHKKKRLERVQQSLRSTNITQESVEGKEYSQKKETTNSRKNIYLSITDTEQEVDDTIPTDHKARSLSKKHLEKLESLPQLPDIETIIDPKSDITETRDEKDINKRKREDPTSEKVKIVVQEKQKKEKKMIQNRQKRLDESVEGEENKKEPKSPKSRKNVEQSAGPRKLEQGKTTWHPRQTENEPDNRPDDRNDVHVPTEVKEYVEGGENRTDSNTPTSRKNVEQSAGTIKMEHKDTTWRPCQTENVPDENPDDRNDVHVPTYSKERGFESSSLNKTKCSGVEKSKKKFRDIRNFFSKPTTEGERTKTTIPQPSSLKV